jgi:hypothetical protein
VAILELTAAAERVTFVTLGPRTSRPQPILVAAP